MQARVVYGDCHGEFEHRVATVNVVDTRAALRRGRQIISAVVNPHLRTLIAGGAPTGDEKVMQALARFDWLDADGSVDKALVRESLDAVELLLTDRAILRVGRVVDLPTDFVVRRELSSAIVRIVFDRLGPSRSVSERTLNAALAMFAGVLSRSDDGASYALRQEREAA
jgi:hypothetical protein